MSEAKMSDEKHSSIFERLNNFFNKTVEKKLDEKSEQIQIQAVAFLIKTVAEEMIKIIGRINEMSDAINKHSAVINELATVQELILQRLKLEAEGKIKTNALKKEDMN